MISLPSHITSSCSAQPMEHRNNFTTYSSVTEVHVLQVGTQRNYIVLDFNLRAFFLFYKFKVTRFAYLKIITAFKRPVKITFYSLQLSINGNQPHFDFRRTDNTLWSNELLS
jgi:hypothetical protein